MISFVIVKKHQLKYYVIFLGCIAIAMFTLRGNTTYNVYIGKLQSDMQEYDLISPGGWLSGFVIVFQDEGLNTNGRVHLRFLSEAQNVLVIETEIKKCVNSNWIHGKGVVIRSLEHFQLNQVNKLLSEGSIIVQGRIEDCGEKDAELWVRFVDDRVFSRRKSGIQYLGNPL